MSDEEGSGDFKATEFSKSDEKEEITKPSGDEKKVPQKKRKLEGGDVSSSKSKAKLEKKKGSQYFDNEAELSGSGEDTDDDNGDDQDDYEYNDFVVKDDEGADVDAIFAKKSKPKLIRNKLQKANKVMVEQDDLDLIEDNLKDSGEISRDRNQADLGDYTDDKPEDENSDDEQPVRRRTQDLDDDDSVDSFIVDDSDNEDNNGGEDDLGKVDRPKKKQGKRRSGHMNGPNQDQMRDVMDIFGTEFGDAVNDFDDMEAGIETDVHEIEPVDAEIAAKAKLRELFSRHELAENFLLEEDLVIKQTDLPERMQSILQGRGAVEPEEREREVSDVNERR